MLTEHLETVSAWVQYLQIQLRPRPKSLCVTLLGDVLGNEPGDIWLKDMTSILEQLGINERWVRTSVFRLVQEGLLEAQRQGRQSQYRLSPHAAVLFANASKKIYSAPTAYSGAWQGQWCLALVGPKQVTEREHRLHRHGFGNFSCLAKGLWASPISPARSALEWRSFADDLIQSSNTSQPLVLMQSSDELTQSSSAIYPLKAYIPQAWNWAHIAQQYQIFIDTFEPLADQLPRLLRQEHKANDDLALLSIRVLTIHAYRRAVLADPHLPADLLPKDWIGIKAYALAQQIYARLLPRTQAYVQSLGLTPTLPNRFL
jgi:phenylacetic acid degradation operon negative regulatory protein